MPPIISREEQLYVITYLLKVVQSVAYTTYFLTLAEVLNNWLCTGGRVV